MIVAQKTLDLDAVSERLALGPQKLLLIRAGEIAGLGRRRLNLERFTHDLTRHGRDVRSSTPRVWRGRRGAPSPTWRRGWKP